MQTKLNLNEANYFSPESNHHYMSVSQFKNFVGSLGMKGCEAKAMASLKGEWEEKTSTAMLVGSYVDAHFEGTLDIFRAKNPDIFTKKGEPKAEFRKAEEIIQRVERDPLFMQFMGGEKQVIMTAELFGVNWKIKIDSYHPDKCIVDLKVMRNIRDNFYVKDYGRLNFIENWGYDLQLAIYQEVVRINTGKQLPCYISAVDKGEYPDIEIIGIDQDKLNFALSQVELNIKRISDVKNGVVEANRCGTCDYCKHTKILKAPIHCDYIWCFVDETNNKDRFSIQIRDFDKYIND